MVFFKYLRNIFTWKPFRRLLFFSLIFGILLIIPHRVIKLNTVKEISKTTETPNYHHGEKGEPVYYDDEDQALVDTAYKLYGYNEFISEKISVNRTIKDVRHWMCLEDKYSFHSTTVSVIIVFYDEGWATLLRTIMSVINRSPKFLLHELILVDDHSNMNHLIENLDTFSLSYGGLIKVVRSPEHEGLIRARIMGAKEATGKYLVFLDSHCEANVEWLEPLIYPITLDYKVVTCPTIDGIEHKTYEYKPYGGIGGETARGSFSWLFYYKERQLTEEQKGERKRLIDPVPTPVMAGGLFAISKKWWLELGEYDPEMYAWGGEQYELSFKVWMCGGYMFNVPCSRVGHIYRGPGLNRNDQGLNFKHPDSINVNYKRVAEVWMDEYKNFLYAVKPGIKNAKNYEKGLNERIHIRNRLKCHSFKWYLENIIKDTLQTAYEPDRSWDTIQSMGSNKCLNILQNQIILTPCNFATVSNIVLAVRVLDGHGLMKLEMMSTASKYLEKNPHGIGVMKKK
ncbi:hypothetical protein HZS_3402 [Henneguya salminicola]|nr:hypothetical protein HZS_3402 [Henneguya salminicola]